MSTNEGFRRGIIFDAYPITENEIMKQMLTKEYCRLRIRINGEELTNCRNLFSFVKYNIKEAKRKSGKEGKASCLI